MSQLSYTGLESDEQAERETRLHLHREDQAAAERFCPSLFTGERSSMANVLDDMAEDCLVHAEHGNLKAAANYIRRLERENKAMRKRLAKGAPNGP